MKSKQNNQNLQQFERNFAMTARHKNKISHSLIAQSLTPQFQVDRADQLGLLSLARQLEYGPLGRAAKEKLYNNTYNNTKYMKLNYPLLKAGA